MSKSSFYSMEELSKLGLKKFGKNVLISKKCSIYSPDNISLGDYVRIDDFCILSGSIFIESFVHIAAYSALYGGNQGIVVREFANISSRVCIYSISDDYSGQTLTNPMIPDVYKNVISAKVIVGKHVIIGTTSVVLPGVHLGEGCAFGSFSFINHSTDPWGIYAGIPCKKIKDRDKKLLIFEEAFLKELKNDMYFIK